MIKLPEDATEDDHLRLLGVLNSSTACFWLKQVSHNKGRPGAEQAGADEPWEHRFEFTGTKLQEYPLPTGYPLGLCREMDKLALRLAAVRPMEIAASGVPSRERLYAAESEWHSVRARMIALQEELDWRFYALYGLLDGELIAPDDAVPELNPGERAFEIVMARQIEAGELETTWFVHHNHKFTPITELPAHWTAEYRAIVEQRIAVIENNRNIALIERPECKRRWATEAGRRCRRRRCGTGSWTGAKRGNCVPPRRRDGAAASADHCAARRRVAARRRRTVSGWSLCPRSGPRQGDRGPGRRRACATSGGVALQGLRW